MNKIIRISNQKTSLYLILKAEITGATVISDFVERSVAESERKLLYGFSIKGRNTLEAFLEMRRDI